MRSTRRRRIHALLVTGLIVVAVFGESGWPWARAGEPLQVQSDGTTFLRWLTFPIKYNTDQGPLGTLSNTQANTLVVDSLAVWSGISTASVSTARICFSILCRSASFSSLTWP